MDLQSPITSKVDVYNYMILAYKTVIEKISSRASKMDEEESNGDDVCNH